MAALDALIDAAASGDLDRVAERHAVRLLGVFGSALRRWHDPDAPEPRDLDIAVSSAGPPRSVGLLDDLVQLIGGRRNGGPLRRESSTRCRQARAGTSRLAISSRTRSSMSSRMSRTTSIGWPAGSVSSQSS